jgi:competence protein ComFB
MEDAVIKVVDGICDEDAASDSPKYCDDPECRMDVVCYVLNRVPQRYVSSARGQAHMETILNNDHQLFVDLVTLTHEGLRRVTSTRRSFYGSQPTSAAGVSGPTFYFPVVKGRLFDGLTFEPITGVEVQLRRDDALVEMLDSRWQNPFELVTNTPGQFLFWPRPISQQDDPESREFELEIRVESEQYETFHHYFSLGLTSTPPMPGSVDLTGEHRLPDLYLIPK